MYKPLLKRSTQPIPTEIQQTVKTVPLPKHSMLANSSDNLMISSKLF